MPRSAEEVRMADKQIEQLCQAAFHKGDTEEGYDMVPGDHSMATQRHNDSRMTTSSLPPRVKEPDMAG